MRRHDFQTLLAQLCLAAFGFSNLAPMAGLVLCVGPHGHVALEPPHEETRRGGDLDLANLSDPPFDLGHPGLHADDSACVDLPILANEQGLRAEAPRLIPPCMTPLFARPAWPEPSRRHPLPGQPHSPLGDTTNTPPVLIRTVILLV